MGQPVVCRDEIKRTNDLVGEDFGGSVEGDGAIEKGGSGGPPPGK